MHRGSTAGNHLILSVDMLAKRHWGGHANCSTWPTHAAVRRASSSALLWMFLFSQDGAPTGWWHSSEQQGYNYLPMMAGQQQDGTIPASSAGSRSSSSQQPFVEVARASSLEDSLLSKGNDMLSQDCRPGVGLMSASGHACYEVWIAMELCDGGTLAEQVQRGFQYCPGSRQVDMVGVWRPVSVQQAQNKWEEVGCVELLPACFSNVLYST